MSVTVPYEEVKAIIRRIREDRVDRMREITLNAHFYTATDDRHYDRYLRGLHGRAQRIRQQRDRSDQVRWTSFLATSTVERMMSAVGHTPVGFYGQPDSNDIGSRVSALATTAFLQSIKNDPTTPLMNVREEMTFRAMLDGQCWIRVGFNPSSSDSENNESAGRSWMSVVKYENFLYPAGCEFVASIPFAIEEMYMPWGDLLAMLPRKRQRIREIMRKMSSSSVMIDDVGHQMEISGRPLEVDGSFLKMNARVWMMSIRPGTVFVGHSSPEVYEFPEGRMILFVWDQELLNTPAPYKDAGVAFQYLPVSFGHDPFKFGLEGISPISRMRAQIPVIERMINEMIEREMYSGRPIRIAPTGSVDIATHRNPKPGTWVEYDAMKGRPEVLSSTGASQIGVMLVNQLVGTIMEESTVREASRGGIPARIESGEALKIALEQDLSRLSNFHLQVDECLRQAMWYRVQLERFYATEDRMLPIFGNNMFREVLSWSADLMRGTAGVYRVSSPTIHFSPEMERRRAIEDFQLGLISHETLADRLALPTSEATQADHRTEHASIAREENRLLAAGGEAKVQSFDDHAVHMYTHLTEILQNRWRYDEETLKTLVQHHHEHEAQQMLEMIGKQALVAGGPTSAPAQPMPLQGMR